MVMGAIAVTLPPSGFTGFASSKVPAPVVGVSSPNVRRVIARVASSI